MGFCSNCMSGHPGAMTYQPLQKTLVALPVVGLIPYGIIMCSMKKQMKTINDSEILKPHVREANYFKMAFVIQLILLLVTPAVLAACDISPWENGWSNHTYELVGFEAACGILLFYTLFQIYRNKSFFQYFRDLAPAVRNDFNAAPPTPEALFAVFSPLPSLGQIKEKVWI